MGTYKCVGGRCGTIYDVQPDAAFTYQVDGNKLFVDGRNSRDDTGFAWDFGDGTTGTGLLASHTYVLPGTYDIKLNVMGPSMFSDTAIQLVTIGTTSSTATSSSISSSRTTR